MLDKGRPPQDHPQAEAREASDRACAVASHYQVEADYISVLLINIFLHALVRVSQCLLTRT